MTALISPFLHKMAGHAVGDERDRNAVLRQLPSGQPGALRRAESHPQRPGASSLPPRPRGLRRAAPHAAVPAGSQRAGVAVREDGPRLGQQRRPVPAHCLVDGNVFGQDALRFLDEPRLLTSSIIRASVGAGLKPAPTP